MVKKTSNENMKVTFLYSAVFNKLIYVLKNMGLKKGIKQ